MPPIQITGMINGQTINLHQKRNPFIGRPIRFYNKIFLLDRIIRSDHDCIWDFRNIIGQYVSNVGNCFLPLEYDGIKMIVMVMRYKYNHIFFRKFFGINDPLLNRPTLRLVQIVIENQKTAFCLNGKPTVGKIPYFGLQITSPLYSFRFLGNDLNPISIRIGDKIDSHIWVLKADHAHLFMPLIGCFIVLSL